MPYRHFNRQVTTFIICQNLFMVICTHRMFSFLKICEAIDSQNNNILFYRCQVYKNFMEKFGEKLRLLRNRQNLTLRQLADVLEVSHSYIGQMERGEKVPNVEMVLKIAQIFNVSTDALIKDEVELED